MKRPRGYSPPAFDCASDTPDISHPVTKRLRRMSCNESLGIASNNNNFNNNIGNNGGSFLASKSDDEVSLAEESQIVPTISPHHSIFMQGRQNKHYQQPAQMYQQQHQSQLGHHQAAASVNATHHVPSENRFLSASGTLYATDYQPMNNILGNLHLMRQQRRQSNAPSSQQQVQTRNHSAMIPQQQQQQLQQPQQNGYHRHYGNYHSVPKTTVNNDGSGTIRSRKKTVSLRVSSNLH